MFRHFTSLILAFAILAGLPKNSFAQTQELSFGVFGVEGIPDTAYFGDVINIEFWIKNTTLYPTTIDGLLQVTFATDSNIVIGGSSFLTNSTQSSFNPLTLYLAFQDSVKITFTETIDNRFAPGDNITVVWPKVINSLPTTAEFAIDKIFIMGFHSNIEANIKETIIFPNPAEDYLSIKNLGANNLEANIYIFDAIGNMVLKVEDYFFNKPLSVKALKTGVYFIQLVPNTEGLKPQITRFSKK